MKHIALRARSYVNGKKAFTSTGLGDRLHGITMGWVYGQFHNTPVTIHLTKSKTIGGHGNKLDSWAEVISLFPVGAVQTATHDYEPTSEHNWLQYLKNKGIDADIHCYKDHLKDHIKEDFPIDISTYFKNIPMLNAEPQDIELPKRFITVQWDSNANSRTLLPATRKKVLAKYKQEYDCESITVGGKAHDKRFKRLKYIAYAMSKAQYHVGVDSAFLHMAPLYMPWNRVHMYNETKKIWSHHMLRAIDNGAPINLYLD